VHVPTTDGRELLLTRYTEPDPELRLLLDKLKLALPAQSPPKIWSINVNELSMYLANPPCREGYRFLGVTVSGFLNQYWY
jgi:hypothetical protein